MCYTNTAPTIKALAIFCVCVNAFNVLYMFMRYQQLLPTDPRDTFVKLEEAMPPVKTLDRYMDAKDGMVLIGGLAGVSIIFDFLLYAGVDNEEPGMVFAAWCWGVLDCSLDFCIGIAAGNMSFMDTLARTLPTTPPENRTTTRRFPHSTTESGPTPVVKGNPANKYRTDNDTEYYQAPRTVPPEPEINEEPRRLPMDKVVSLILYVTFRLCFKTVALAGIQDYATRLRATLRKKGLGGSTPAHRPSDLSLHRDPLLASSDVPSQPPEQPSSHTHSQPSYMAPVQSTQGIPFPGAAMVPLQPPYVVSSQPMQTAAFPGASLGPPQPPYMASTQPMQTAAFPGASMGPTQLPYVTQPTQAVAFPGSSMGHPQPHYVSSAQPMQAVAYPGAPMGPPTPHANMQYNPAGPHGSY